MVKQPLICVITYIHIYVITHINGCLLLKPDCSFAPQLPGGSCDRPSQGVLRVTNRQRTLGALALISKVRTGKIDTREIDS